MDAARMVLLTIKLDNAPKGMRFITMKTMDEFTKKSYVECTCFEVGVYEDGFGIRVKVAGNGTKLGNYFKKVHLGVSQ